jgi:hypothetical protein
MEIMTKGRPKGITILSMLMALSGIFYVIITLLFWFLSMQLGMFPELEIPAVSALISILVGLALFALAIWLYNFKRLAWPIAVVLLAVESLNSFGGFLDGNLISVIIFTLDLAIIVYLLVISQRFFRIAKMSIDERAREGIFNDFFDVFSDVFVVFVVVLFELIAVPFIVSVPGSVCRSWIIPVTTIVVALTLTIFYWHYTKEY